MLLISTQNSNNKSHKRLQNKIITFPSLPVGLSLKSSTLWSGWLDGWLSSWSPCSRASHVRKLSFFVLSMFVEAALATGWSHSLLHWICDEVRNKAKYDSLFIRNLMAFNFLLLRLLPHQINYNVLLHPPPNTQRLLRSSGRRGWGLICQTLMVSL